MEESDECIVDLLFKKKRLFNKTSFNKSESDSEVCAGLLVFV